MFKIINFLFFAQKVSSGMGALHPKFLGNLNFFLFIFIIYSFSLIQNYFPIYLV